MAPPRSRATRAPPLVDVFHDFVDPKPVTLVCKEKVLSLSGDSFSIKGLDNNVVCRVEGSTFTLHGTKTFMAPQGQKLFKLKKNMMTWHGRRRAIGPNGKVVFEVKGSMFRLLSSKMIATFTNASDGRKHKIVCKGNWRDSKCQLTLDMTGPVLATIKRESFNMKHLVAGKQTYTIEVKPGVDHLLIAALAVVFDDMNNDGP